MRSTLYVVISAASAYSQSSRSIERPHPQVMYLNGDRACWWYYHRLQYILIFIVPLRGRSLAVSISVAIDSVSGEISCFSALPGQPIHRETAPSSQASHWQPKLLAVMPSASAHQDIHRSIERRLARSDDLDVQPSFRRVGLMN